jgi:hypothetical protein
MVGERAPAPGSKLAIAALARDAIASTMPIDQYRPQRRTPSWWVSTVVLKSEVVQNICADAANPNEKMPGGVATTLH